MSLTGCLRKMPASLAETVQYELPVDEARLPLNPLLGQNIRLHFSGNIYCIECGRKTNKSFCQGHCFPCSRKLASCDMCILKPETCHFYQDTCREPEWAQDHCMQAHYIYLANTSGLKVGITRGSQVPTRWIDQGASQALAIATVEERLHAGLFEVAIARHVSDKTNWRNLLKGTADEINLQAEKERLLELAELPDVPVKILENGDITRINYPVLEYPIKISSLNAEKTPEIKGKMLGIKGQYLILDSGVINIRKYTGYEITVAT